MVGCRLKLGYDNNMVVIAQICVTNGGLRTVMRVEYRYRRRE